MKKIQFSISILALVLSGFALFASQQSDEQVYVDVNRLLDGYNRTSIVKSEFEEKANAMKSNVDSLLSNWQNELKTYEKERAAMSKKELALKQELLQTKQEQINGYQQAIQKQLQEEDQKVTQTVINDINDFIKTYGEENGYQIILGATGGGTIMYADEASDLTDEVLAELNAQFDAK